MPAILYWLDFVVVPAIMLVLAFEAMPITDGNVLSFAFAGYLCWVFFEYFMHRVLFHNPRSIYWRPHITHHHRPFAEEGMPTPGLAPVALGVLSGLAVGLLGLRFGSAWALGFLLGYMTYIVTHHLVHNGTITGPIAQRHELHHRGWHLNFNLMCPLGDLVFGTYKEVEQPWDR